MSSEKDLEKIHISVNYLKQAIVDPALQGITYDDFVRAVYLCAEGDKSIFGEIQSTG